MVPRGNTRALCARQDIEPIFSADAALELVLMCSVVTLACLDAPGTQVQLSAPALRRTGNEGAVVQRASRRMMTPQLAVGVRPSQMTDATKGGGKSVLVFSWFYAAPKELELVKRIYKKKGFSKVVVQESIVKEIATPRGWYRTYEKFTGGAELDKELQAKLFGSAVRALLAPSSWKDPAAMGAHCINACLVAMEHDEGLAANWLGSFLDPCIN
mgnify:CR=1 FL=1